MRAAIQAVEEPQLISKVKMFRDRVEYSEGILNRLHGTMSPQLLMEIEYMRHVSLQKLLEQQLLEFDRG